jgi:universal stress protein E
MNKRVLVIADIEDDDFLSLEKARDIAQPISASLEVVKFTQYDSKSDLTLEQHMEKVEQVLDSMLEKVFENKSEITSKVVNSAKIDEWIVERCECHREHIDLVIKGGHRTESLFHTPTDWKLIRHLPCPILIASHTKWNSKPNILMTLDLSTKEAKHQRLNELTLQWGDTWSKATHTELHAMYSIPIPKALLELDIVDKHQVELKKAPMQMDKMQSMLAQKDMDSVVCHVPAGPPDKTIPHLANELNSDLVIMGCLGHEGISGWLLGNTAEKVLHHLRTDCLVIMLPHD